jgi:IclR family transcriptional regulator, acetate operon repressor
MKYSQAGRLSPPSSEEPGPAAPYERSAAGGDERSPGTRIQSVSRACQLLLWLAGRHHGATAKEVAFANQLALPTTYHLLNTLADQGLVAKNSQRRYVLGQSTAILAQAYLRGPSVPESLLAALRELSVLTQETAYLAEWRGFDIRVLASIEGTKMLRVADVAMAPYEDGHARANGKVLLAYAPPEVREAYLRSHPLRRLTPATVCDRRDLDVELARVRTQGFAYDIEAFAEGVSCVAAPLLDNGRVIAAFGLSVPAESFKRNRRELTEAVLSVIGDLKAGKFDRGVSATTVPG